MGSAMVPADGRRQGRRRASRSGELAMSVLEADLRPSHDHHPRLARERDRRGRACRAARPTSSSTCSPSRARRGSSSTSTTSSAISARTPLLADLKPGGRFVATDLYRAGRRRPCSPSGCSRRGPARATRSTVTGRTIGEEAADAEETDGPGGRAAARRAAEGRPAGLAILRGNLAPEGCVVKLAGTERTPDRGPARVFESEEDASPPSTAGDRSGRRRRDPQRGPVGRPGDARDAPGHGGDRRRGPRRVRSR